MTVAGYRYRVSPLLWRLGCFSSSYGFRVFGQVYLNPLQALNDQAWHPKKKFPQFGRKTHIYFAIHLNNIAIHDFFVLC